jgi:hypothetical protein
MKKKKVKAEARRIEDAPGYVNTSASRPPRPVFRGRNIQGDVRGERGRDKTFN